MIHTGTSGLQIPTGWLVQENCFILWTSEISDWISLYTLMIGQVKFSLDKYFWSSTRPLDKPLFFCEFQAHVHG